MANAELATVGAPTLLRTEALLAEPRHELAAAVAAADRAYADAELDLAAELFLAAAGHAERQAQLATLHDRPVEALRFRTAFDRCRALAEKVLKEAAGG